MELLQLHIGNLSGNYMNALCDYNNSSLLYKNYGHGNIILNSNNNNI